MCERVKVTFIQSSASHQRRRSVIITANSAEDTTILSLSDKITSSLHNFVDKSGL